VLRNPLLLVIALAAEEAGKVLPADRAALYASVVDALVRTWNQARRPDDALHRSTGAAVDAPEMLRALADAALTFYERGLIGHSVHRGEWIRGLARRLSERDAEGALEVLVEQAGLLVHDGPDRLRFWHASLGEYLAATALARAADDLPWRIIQPTNSPQGREIVRLAIAAKRSADGDASRMFATLLDEAHDGPWTRLFGAPIGVAVDCVLDGHPLTQAGFSALLARVIDLVLCAPLDRNTELLARLVAARPDFQPAPAEERRLLALLADPTPLLKAHVEGALTRWLANAIPRSPDAHQFCLDILERERHPGAEPAALGLLRAGDVHPDACGIVADLLGHDRHGEPPLEPSLLAAINHGPPHVRAARLADLRALLVSDGATTDRRDPRHDAAAILALLGDDSGVAAILATPHTSDGLSSAHRDALGWCARTSDTARQALAGALVTGPGPRREAAEEVLQDMLQKPDRAAVAAAIVLSALVLAGDRLPDALALLDRDVHLFGRTRERNLLDVLRAMAHSGPVACTALVGRCRDPDAAPFEARWLLSVVVWDAGQVDDLMPCLLLGVMHPDRTIAVISASHLRAVWPQLADDRRALLVRAWVRGLACPAIPPSTPADDPAWSREPPPPIDAPAQYAWDALAASRSNLGESGEAMVRDALASAHPLQRTIAACVLLGHPLVSPRCEAILAEALVGPDPQPARVAARYLRTHTASALGEPLTRAELRLALTGWTHPPIRHDVPSDALLAEFFAAPCTIDFTYHAHTMWRATLAWLAAHPEARATALTHLAADDRTQQERAAWLLATGIETSKQLEALVEDTQLSGTTTAAAHVAAHVLRRGAEAHDALGKVARHALATLLRDQLASPDLDRVHAAVHQLWRHAVFSQAQQPARQRLLHASVLCWRVEQVARWLAWAPADREASAQQWFGEGVAAIAAALRPCVDDNDDTTALHAGLLLVRLVQDSEPVRARSASLLAEAPPPAAPVHRQNYRHDDLTNFLRSTAARSLRRLLDLVDGWTDAQRLALAVLIEHDDERASPALHAITERWAANTHSIAIVEPLHWIMAHRLAWWPAYEPHVADRLVTCDPEESHQTVDWLRSKGLYSPTLRSAALGGCAEWLFDDSNFRDEGDIPPDVLAPWRGLLHDPDAAVRTRAALALTHAGVVDDSVIRGLMEVFLANFMPLAARAWDLLQQPERRERFLSCRRQRAAHWQTSEEAFDLLYMWSSLDDAAPDHDVIVPLLRAAITSPSDGYAVRAAIDLWPHDRPLATAALLARSPRSLDAATFLHLRGEPDADTLLWHALEQWRDDRHWHTAAVVLSRDDANAARLIPTLTRIAGRDRSGTALWLLHGISPPAALCGLLEHLARARTSTWDDLHNLAAMAAGGRPGSPPIAVLSGVLHHHNLSPPASDVQPWTNRNSEPALHAALRFPTNLQGIATSLIQLEHSPALSPDLRTLVERDMPVAMATLLGGDAAAWTPLWQRAPDARATDITEIRRIVDGRADDSPGQRLARLWWLMRLPAAAMLEREQQHLIIGDHATPEIHLIALLKIAYPDEPGLRRALAAQNLADELLGSPVKLVDLRADAARVLLHRRLDESALRRAVDDGLLPGAALNAWLARPAC
jgi:hypothetical protein